jgi:hypothetical protein
VIIEVALVNERRSTFRLPLSATRHSGRFATRAYRLNYWLSTRKILDFINFQNALHGLSLSRYDMPNYPIDSRHWLVLQR